MKCDGVYDTYLHFTGTIANGTGHKKAEGCYDFCKNPMDCHQLETVVLLHLFSMLLCRSDIF